MNQNKFIYLSSWDEVTWTIDVNKRRVHRVTFDWDLRLDFVEWVKTCCTRPVYCWNGTSTPDLGSTNYHHYSMPSAHSWLIFDLKIDESFFLLRYSNIEHVDIQTYQNGIKAWHESRK